MTINKQELKEIRYFLFLDLEATCCEDDLFPPSEMEIIEIGAFLLDQNFSELDQFNEYVRPIRNPVLTPFCTELTSITQGDVDSAESFSQVAKKLESWLVGYEDYAFCSWGNYDKNQFELDSSRHRVQNPISDAKLYINLKDLFAKQQKIGKQCGMARAMFLAELEMRGRSHRAINDAKNMLQLAPYTLGDKKIEPKKRAAYRKKS